ncbi:Fc receptor-like A isoform X7 [Puma concolor]|uniref:Fc receptor-like A isoform X7 n=1 Tax=Puma concolor TaxID=9696 RepID=A0A6P6I636_PUMCO|nr:Fc receptor-like A isoform X7 [Puma concolor]
MLKKISALEAAGDLNTVTMKLGCVCTAGAFHFSPTMLWAGPMLLAASFETLQCEGPVSTQDSSCDTEEDLTSPREVDFQFKGYTFSKPFHLIVSYGPSSSTAAPTLSPAPQKSTVPESTTTESPGPHPPLSTPSKNPGFSSPLRVPDPHLNHQMGILLKQMQDMRALLGHLVMELRDLSGHLKLETTKGHAK